MVTCFIIIFLRCQKYPQAASEEEALGKYALNVYFARFQNIKPKKVSVFANKLRAMKRKVEEGYSIPGEAKDFGMNEATFWKHLKSVNMCT